MPNELIYVENEESNIINHKKHNHISNTIYKIRGRESLNDFIFMSLFFFCITKNNSNL